MIWIYRLQQRFAVTRYEGIVLLVLAALALATPIAYLLMRIFR